MQRLQVGTRCACKTTHNVARAKVLHTMQQRTANDTANNTQPTTHSQQSTTQPATHLAIGVNVSPKSGDIAPTYARCVDIAPRYEVRSLHHGIRHPLRLQRVEQCHHLHRALAKASYTHAYMHTHHITSLHSPPTQIQGRRCPTPTTTYQSVPLTRRQHSSSSHALHRRHAARLPHIQSANCKVPNGIRYRIHYTAINASCCKGVKHCQRVVGQAKTSGRHGSNGAWCHHVWLG